MHFLRKNKPIKKKTFYDDCSCEIEHCILNQREFFREAGKIVTKSLLW